MKPMTSNVTAWQPYPHFGMAAYRIYVRCFHGVWQQCHEWKRKDGTVVLEPWIKSVKPTEKWLEAATPCRDPQ
jgi:hypothetical protein